MYGTKFSRSTLTVCRNHRGTSDERRRPAIFTMKKRPKTKHIRVGVRQGGAWYEISQSIAHAVMDCTGYVVDVVIIPRRRLDQPELFSVVDTEKVAKEVVAKLK